MHKALALVTVLAVVPNGVRAQVPVASPPGWEEASRAPAGSPIRLTLRDRSVVSGVLVETQADHLVVRDHKLERGRFTRDLTKPYAFSRSDLTKVEVKLHEARSGKKTILLALVTVGAVVGIIALVIVARCASEIGRCGA